MVQELKCKTKQVEIAKWNNRARVGLCSEEGSCLLGGMQYLRSCGCTTTRKSIFPWCGFREFSTCAGCSHFPRRSAENLQFKHYASWCVFIEAGNKWAHSHVLFLQIRLSCFAIHTRLYKSKQCRTRMLFISVQYLPWLNPASREEPAWGFLRYLIVKYLG